MRLLFAIIISLFVTTAIAQHQNHNVQNQDQKSSMTKTQTLCPVLGNPIDKTVYTDYKGNRIYFCCSGCIDSFKKDPEMYINKMKKAGIILEKSPQKANQK